ncbi:hypothetical protein [Devosia sp. A369]
MDVETEEGREGRPVRVFLVRSMGRPRAVWLHHIVEDDIDNGAKIWAEFEVFRAGEGLEVCLRDEAEADVVLATIIEPSHLSGEAAVVELMRRMDSASPSVHYGFVRVAELYAEAG